MLDLGTAVGYLLLDTKGFSSGFKSALQSVKTMQSESATTGDKFYAMGSAMTSVGGTLTKTVTLPLIGMGTAAVKAAVDFESAFTGVRKTVDATEDEYDELSRSITAMSNRLPQSASEIAGVMEVAGQLGIRGTENLLSFTETMIMLGDATNLSSEEAATSIARVMNIMGTAGTDVSRFGSTVVALGNNFATTESEIVAMTNRLAAGGKLAGLTEPELLALAAAMSSVGIEAEAGGTAMTQTFNAIETAVASGGDTLKEFARVSGMSSEEFKEAWQNKPIQALQSFITGLGQLEGKGESTVLVLDNLGLTGIRQSNMLKSLALASGMLADSLDLANQSWNENDALSKEAETRYGTLASKISILGNNIVNLVRSFGELLLPSVDKAISGIQSITSWISNLDESQKKTLVTILEVVAVIGPLLLVFGKLSTAIGAVIGLFTGTGGLATVMTVLTGPIGIVIAAVAALAAAWITDFGGIREFTAEIVGIISETIQTFLSNIKETWNTDLLGIRTTAEQIWSSIQQIFSNVLNVIRSIFKIFSAAFRGDWKAVWEGVKDLASNVWNLIKSLFVTFLNTIVNLLVNIGASLYAAALSAWNMIKDGASSAWETLMSWLNTVAEDPVNAILGIGSSMVSAGSSIISSLWDGLKSMWSSVAAWFEEKAAWISGVFSNIGSFFGGASGSYASGLDYVTQDRIVKVHEGEAILTKEENRERLQNQNRSNGGDTYNFYSPKALNPTTAAREMKKAKQQLALGLA